MKKFSIILCFALFCVVIFSGNVFAAQRIDLSEFGYGRVDVQTDNPIKKVVYRDTSDTLRMVVAINESGENVDDFVSFITDEDSSRISIVANKKTGYLLYTYFPSTVVSTWKVDNSSITSLSVGGSVLINSAVSEFLISDNPITANGTVVFPEPPTPTLTQVIQEETTRAQGTILKAMKVIALCGVGCLALLLALPILSRVFSRYR